MVFTRSRALLKFISLLICALAGVFAAATPQLVMDQITGQVDRTDKGEFQDFSEINNQSNSDVTKQYIAVAKTNGMNVYDRGSEIHEVAGKVDYSLVFTMDRTFKDSEAMTDKRLTTSNIQNQSLDFVQFGPNGAQAKVQCKSKTCITVTADFCDQLLGKLQEIRGKQGKKFESVGDMVQDVDYCSKLNIHFDDATVAKVKEAETVADKSWKNLRENYLLKNNKTVDINYYPNYHQLLQQSTVNLETLRGASLVNPQANVLRDFVRQCDESGFANKYFNGLKSGKPVLTGGGTSTVN